MNTIILMTFHRSISVNICRSTINSRDTAVQASKCRQRLRGDGGGGGGGVSPGKVHGILPRADLLLARTLSPCKRTTNKHFNSASLNKSLAQSTDQLINLSIS